MMEKRMLVRQAHAALKRFDGNPADEAMIAARVNLFFVDKPSLAELREALDFLQEQGWADMRHAPLARLWAITERGRFAQP